MLGRCRSHAALLQPETLRQQQPSGCQGTTEAPTRSQWLIKQPCFQHKSYLIIVKPVRTKCSLGERVKHFHVTQFGSGKPFSLDNAGKTIVLAGEDASANHTAYIWFVDNSLDGSSTVSATDTVLIGTLATFEVNSFTINNFSFVA